jgi:hypothetical protein
MKKVVFNTLLVFVLLSLYSCKNQELTPVNNVDITPDSNTMGDAGTPFDASTQTLISQGTFKNGGRYSTSGTAKLYRKGTTYTLVFESFKTDEGPDLRIYLSEDTGARNCPDLVQAVLGALRFGGVEGARANVGGSLLHLHHRVPLRNTIFVKSLDGIVVRS